MSIGKEKLQKLYELKQKIKEEAKNFYTDKSIDLDQRILVFNAYGETDYCIGGTFKDKGLEGICQHFINTTEMWSKHEKIYTEHIFGEWWVGLMYKKKLKRLPSKYGGFEITEVDRPYTPSQDTIDKYYEMVMNKLILNDEIASFICDW